MKIRVQTLLDVVRIAILVLGMGMALLIGNGLKAASPAKARPFIIDYQHHLNKRFKKILRSSTRYIIIHTSEAGLESTLRTLSRGKRVSRYRTIGGHAHYAIARDGQVYRILQHRYRADHAGLSMWNGLEDLSSYSLGIELVGYHYGTITPQQYRSLSRLLDILQRVYSIADKNVLTHSQVSYGKPNTWFKRPHRGRKRCALNFQREKAGLKDRWTYDPDVRAGRLARDRHIYAMFYKKPTRRPRPAVTAAPTPAAPVSPEKISTVPNLTNIISRYNTAWNIAGEDFDDPSTLYLLPGGQAVRGDQVEKEVGWNRIPRGTKVLLNQPKDVEKEKGPIFLVNQEYTAWSFAGPDYSKPTTFYFLPQGGIKSGIQVADWDSIPGGTRMIMGYNGPFTIQNLKGKTPWGIAGKYYNHTDTIYFIPPKTLSTGNRIKDFNDLPQGSMVFLKMTN
jgi:N-acetylmuramoyl-L-alanine amidase